MAEYIAIYFTKEEKKKLDKAEKYSLVKGRMFLNMLLKSGLENIRTHENKMVFEIEMKPKFKNGDAISKTVRVEPEIRKEIDKICSYAPFSRSGLARYLIIPELDKIIKNEGGKYSV